MGWVLREANADRERLARELQSASLRVDTLKQQLDRLSQESNQKVSAAAEEVARAKAQLQTQTQLQANLKTATPLTPPAPWQTRKWTETASVPMGVAIRVPPAMQVSSSDDGLFISAKKYVQRSPIDEQWFALTTYRPDREREIRSRLSSVSEIRYSLAGRLLQGTRGTFMEGNQTLYLLSIQDNASTTHLLWAKTMEGVNERTILDTLATLSFR